ncbi:hypothetical protein RFI_08069 [Reticulomyxa filosa]|uniref:Uncharacterized protein n=1 Tax=Reticulomyxa filosa TaxID=46433 RepID=X6NUW4_RETFI|nr:hypothetical protein RFI_08069 [Reticulomyxa filosa]|eukprot:ETO29057.1 hypothetical protein RFI_08069 [Reticulomyxa filosa]
MYIYIYINICKYTIYLSQSLSSSLCSSKRIQIYIITWRTLDLNMLHDKLVETVRNQLHYSRERESTFNVSSVRTNSINASLPTKLPTDRSSSTYSTQKDRNNPAKDFLKVMRRSITIFVGGILFRRTLLLIPLDALINVFCISLFYQFMTPVYTKCCDGLERVCCTLCATDEGPMLRELLCRDYCCCSCYSQSHEDTQQVQAQMQKYHTNNAISTKPENTTKNAIQEETSLDLEVSQASQLKDNITDHMPPIIEIAPMETLQQRSIPGKEKKTAHENVNNQSKGKNPFITNIELFGHDSNDEKEHVDEKNPVQTVIGDSSPHVDDVTLDKQLSHSSKSNKEMDITNLELAEDMDRFLSTPL